MSATRYRAAPPNTATLLDHLVAALTRAAVYNRDDQIAPAAILWPDPDRA